MANSSHSNSSSTNETILDRLGDGQLVEWLSQNGKNIVYVLLASIALLIFIYRFTSSRSQESEQSYLQAAQEYTLFLKTSQNNDLSQSREHLKQLTGAMDKHPELHAAYDGTIAQLLINADQTAEALPFAQATLDRTKQDHLPLFADYATTTLLIAQKKHQEALEKSLLLQEHIISALNTAITPAIKNAHEGLFAFNLLRIGMLQQELGNHQAELQTWNLWKHYAGLTKTTQPTPISINPQVFHTVTRQLAIGTLSLLDYMSYRESILKD